MYVRFNWLVSSHAHTHTERATEDTHLESRETHAINTLHALKVCAGTWRMRDFYAISKLWSAALCKQQLIDKHIHTHTHICHKYHFKPYKYLQFANFVAQRGVCAIFDKCIMQVSEAAASPFMRKLNFKAHKERTPRARQRKRGT